ncbi:nitrate ABC transporter permease [Tepidicaulis sp. LMO-SS28]|uniref:nitrate ABC transporter permease n=1 Tax=Tepidicaulis sp. LMO-SS28 TaxID=3447455 RepID=UPI003EE1D949
MKDAALRLVPDDMPEPESTPTVKAAGGEGAASAPLVAEVPKGWPDSASPWLRDLLATVVPAFVLPLITFIAVLMIWTAVQATVAPEIPTVERTFEKAVEIFSDPFYVYGPNDMGIAWQVYYSLGRVLAGFALAVAVGLPVGFLIGTSKIFETAWMPLIQILRPVSPLAWLPIGLLLFKAVDPSAIFVIFITSIWPVILNAAAGVRAVPEDYTNVARVLNFNRAEMVRKIYLPATAPYILTGMQLSLSTAWMVIVAAEMLTGGIGIGFFIWDEWNNLSVPSILVAIGVIGVVGILLEALMKFAQRRFDYGQV